MNTELFQGVWIEQYTQGMSIPITFSHTGKAKTSLVLDLEENALDSVLHRLEKMYKKRQKIAELYLEGHSLEESAEKIGSRYGLELLPITIITQSLVNDVMLKYSGLDGKFNSNKPFEIEMNKLSPLAKTIIGKSVLDIMPAKEFSTVHMAGIASSQNKLSVQKHNWLILTNNETQEQFIYDIAHSYRPGIPSLYKVEEPLKAELFSNEFLTVTGNLLYDNSIKKDFGIGFRLGFDK